MSIPKIIRVLFYWLFFLTPLIMYSGTSELFEFNKMLFIYAVAVIVSSLYVIDIVVHKKSFFHNKLLSFTIFLFLLSQILSTLFSIDTHTSLFGYYGRFNGGLFSIIAYISLFYAFINYFDAKTIKKLLLITMISSFIVILWGIPARFGHDLSCLLFTGRFDINCWTDQFRPAERMFSTLGQPNWLGAYLAIHFFIGIYFLFNEEKKSAFEKYPYFIYIVFVFVSILFTRSRSAMISIAPGYLLLPLVFYFLKKKNILKKYVILSCVFIILIIVFKTGITVIDAPFNRSKQPPVSTSKKETVSTSVIPSSSPVTESFDIRKIVWKGAIDLGKKYPIFGTGVETFAYAYYFVRPPEHNLTSEWDYLYNKAHNEYLNYFATTGYVGIVTYLLMIGSVFYIFLRNVTHKKKSYNERLLSICLILSYVTILITNFFGFSTTVVNLFFYLIPAVLLVIFYSPEQVYVKRKLAIYHYITIVAVIGLAGYYLFFLLQYWRADLIYNGADQYFRTSEYQLSAVEYDIALKMHYEHVYEDKLSYVLANLSYLSSDQKEKKLPEDLIDVAQYYNKKTLLASPQNVLYWKTTAKNDYLFYQSTLDAGYIEDGIEALKTGLRYSPTDMKLYYSLSLFYSLLEDEKKDEGEKKSLQKSSLNAIDKAIRLKPDYRDSYFLKGQLLKKYGNTDEARKVFESILQLNPEDPEVKKELESLQ